MVLVVHMTHNEPDIDMATYLRAYMAKRRSDSNNNAAPDGNTMRYNLTVSLPTWLKRLVGLVDLPYDETVTIVAHGGSVTAVDVHASCVSADVDVVMSMRPMPGGGGTCIDCEARVPTSYRGIPIPGAALRMVVRRRFNMERRRDKQFADAL